MTSEEFMYQQGFVVKDPGIHWTNGMFGIRKPQNNSGKYYLGIWINGTGYFMEEIGKAVTAKNYNNATERMLYRIQHYLKEPPINLTHILH